MKMQAHVDWYSVNEQLHYQYLVSVYNRHSSWISKLGFQRIPLQMKYSKVCLIFFSTVVQKEERDRGIMAEVETVSQVHSPLNVSGRKGISSWRRDVRYL